jgi:hypothetical protein
VQNLSRAQLLLPGVKELGCEISQELFRSQTLTLSQDYRGESQALEAHPCSPSFLVG